MNTIRKTGSLCPVCLEIIDARIVEENGHMYMVKSCTEHGRFKTVVWRENADRYMEWIRAAGKQPQGGLLKPRAPLEGCPWDCGYCAEHRQDLCSAALMVTSRCNLDCPVCFTRGKNEAPYHPALSFLKATLRHYLDLTGSPYPLEFCGGEPTLRDDLPHLASYARSLGFDYIQVNTNGVRIAEDTEYLAALKAGGATTVYLGFDGFNDETYNYTCGRSLLEKKLKAVENCERAKIAVVLVPVVVPGKNENELGEIIEYAKDHTPAVKGVFFQPISYFGQVPKVPGDADRITIPELMDLIEAQSRGSVKRSHFLPPSCSHSLCSFNGFFLVKNRRLYPMTRFQPKSTEQDPAARTRRIIRRNWTYNGQTYLTISAMAFQDAWNIDLERLKQCTIGILSEKSGIVPLCAKYVTSRTGERLYPGIA